MNCAQRPADLSTAGQAAVCQGLVGLQVRLSGLGVTVKEAFLDLSASGIASGAIYQHGQILRRRYVSVAQTQEYTRIVKRFRNETLIARMTHERNVLDSAVFSYKQYEAECWAQLASGVQVAVLSLGAASVAQFGVQGARAALAGRVAAQGRYLTHNLKAMEASVAGPAQVQRAARAFAAAKGLQNMAVSTAQVVPRGYAFYTALGGIAGYLIEGGDPVGAIGALFKATHGLREDSSPVVIGLLEVALAFNHAVYRRQLVVGNTSAATNSVCHWSGKVLQGQLNTTYRKYETALNGLSGTSFKASLED
jgi:hypothetical protein